MKSLDVKLGGHPLLGDDMDFLQDGLREAFIAFLEGFLGDFVIISGVEFTVGANIDWTAGWIYMDGEILQVDAGSAAYVTNNSFEIVETADPSGNIQYEDGNTEDPYTVRKASLTTVGGAYLWTSAKRLKKFRSGVSPTLLGAWSSPGNAANYGFNLIGEIVFKNNVAVASYNAGTDSVLFNLQAAYRPSETRIQLVSAVINSVRTFIHLEIDTNGDVKPLGLSNSDVVTIHLFGLRLTAF